MVKTNQSFSQDYLSWFSVSLCFLECLAYSGIQFGWASLVHLFKSIGYFSYKCTEDHFSFESNTTYSHRLCEDDTKSLCTPSGRLPLSDFLGKSTNSSIQWQIDDKSRVYSKFSYNNVDFFLRVSYFPRFSPMIPGLGAVCAISFQFKRFSAGAPVSYLHLKLKRMIS